MTKKALLDPLIHLLEIPSISTQEKYLPDMKRVRHYLLDLFTSLDFKTKILKGEKHSAVYAEKITDKNLPTVLIYGHYDVQPPDPLASWKYPPFKPKVEKGKLYARGATDNKGQFMIHIMTLKALLKEKGSLPVNFKFIIEGEEEIGSPSVENLAKKYAKSLFSADYILVSDSAMPKIGQPAIDISLRGLLYTEVNISVSKYDLHSGQFGGVAANPAQILSRIITKLKDENNKILIPNFYDSVSPPSKEELSDYKKLKTKKDQIIKEGNLYGMGGGEKAYSINERRWTRPTLDVSGIWGGYQEEGSKTIIPSQAGAKISMRLVPNQQPNKIFTLFKKYVKKLTPSYAKVKVTHLNDCLPYKAPTDDLVFSLMKDSLKRSFKKEAVYSAVGGSIGFVPVLSGALNVPCLLAGFGNQDDNLHAPNEHFRLSNYYRGIDAMKYFYSNLS